MSLRKHFSFKNEEAFKHVLCKRNASAYIEELVLQDMKKQQHPITYVTLEDVERIVKQFIQNNPNLVSVNPVEDQNLIMNSIKNSILGL